MSDEKMRLIDVDLIDQILAFIDCSSTGAMDIEERLRSIKADIATSSSKIDHLTAALAASQQRERALRDALIHRCAVQHIDSTCASCREIIALVDPPLAASPPAPAAEARHEFQSKCKRPHHDCVCGALVDGYACMAMRIAPIHQGVR